MKLFLKLLEEVGRPNIYLIPRQQFEWLEGDRVYGNYEMAAIEEPVITLNPRIPSLRGRVLSNALYHGILHKLFPEAEEWWVWMGGHVLARGGDDGQDGTEGHSYDELPNREELIKMCIAASKKFNRRNKKR